MRKEIVGDWKNCFLLETKNIFDKYVEYKLIIWGYEMNYGWMNDE